MADDTDENSPSILPTRLDVVGRLTPRWALSCPVLGRQDLAVMTDKPVADNEMTVSIPVAPADLNPFPAVKRLSRPAENDGLDRPETVIFRKAEAPGRRGVIPESAQHDDADYHRNQQRYKDFGLP